ncbi:MAG: matrixin family metalloprotease [Bryobacteraceae bacterium]
MTKRVKHSGYLLLAYMICVAMWAAGPIHLKTRDLTAAGYSAVQSLHAGEREPGHLLVQFVQPPRAEDLRELQRRGIRVVGAAPDGGITISMDHPASLDGLGVQWAGPLLSQDKISPLLSANSTSSVETVLVEFHPDVNPRRAIWLVRDMNLQTLRNPDLARNHLLVFGPASRIYELAGLDEVAYIFPASQDLIQGTHVLACSGMVMTQGPVGQYVTAGNGWGGADADGVVKLDYAFSNMGSKLPAASAQSEIIRALEEWTKYANVRFSVGSGSGSRTVTILFARGVHGDGYPFEPGSRILAHTFFPSPPNAEPIAGDMHLNEDQDWHIGTDIDVYTVALHEAGHALGLAHTDNPDAVMYPYYRFGKVLSSDDIAGIQKLYGNPDKTSGPPIAPLKLSILEPASTAVTTSAASIAISGTASGGAGDWKVAWRSDRGGSGAALGSANWSIPIAPLLPGQNNFTLRVTDSGGGSATGILAVLRQQGGSDPGDPVPGSPPAPGLPTLSISSPALTIVSTSAAAITFSGTAGASVTEVKWTNSTGGSGEAAGTVSWVAAGIPLLVGTNNVTVRAYNAVGDSAWRAVTVVRQ